MSTRHNDVPVQVGSAYWPRFTLSTGLWPLPSICVELPCSVELCLAKDNICPLNGRAASRGAVVRAGLAWCAIKLRTEDGLNGTGLFTRPTTCVEKQGGRVATPAQRILGHAVRGLASINPSNSVAGPTGKQVRWLPR